MNETQKTIVKAGVREYITQLIDFMVWRFAPASFFSLNRQSDRCVFIGRSADPRHKWVNVRIEVSNSWFRLKTITLWIIYNDTDDFEQYNLTRGVKRFVWELKETVPEEVLDYLADAFGADFDAHEEMPPYFSEPMNSETFERIKQGVNEAGAATKAAILGALVQKITRDHQEKARKM